MSHREFIDWQAYHRIEPFGVLAERQGFGYIVSMLASWCGWNKDSVQNMGAFFPELGEVKEKKKVDWDSPEGQVALGRMWVERTGGKVIEGKANA